MIVSLEQEKKCCTCNKIIRGRSDKKFCNEYCRNVYNNKAKSADSPTTKHINKILNKNRVVLKLNISKQQAVRKIKKETLREQGFVFKYHTHLFNRNNGNPYFFIYDFGYLSLCQEWCLVFEADQLLDK